MKVFLYGHECLGREGYDAVTDVDQATKARDILFRFLREYDLPGASAPQLGMPINMIAFKDSENRLVELINPRITKMYGLETERSEGCFSCPPTKANQCAVARIQVVHVEASKVDRLGWTSEYKFKGSDSRRIQHEIDHLAGIFFFERASTGDRKKITEKFGEWVNLRKIADLTVNTKVKEAK